MSDKKVDGIRKLSREEIRKSRKIVLNTIGEEMNLANAAQENMSIEEGTRRENSRGAVPPPTSAAKKVDGIRPLKGRSPGKTEEKTNKSVLPPRPVRDPENKYEDKPEDEMSAEEKEKIRKWREKAKGVLSFDTRDDSVGAVRSSVEKEGEKNAKPLSLKRKTTDIPTRAVDKRPAVLPQRRSSRKSRGIMNFIMKNYTEGEEEAPKLAEKKKEKRKKDAKKKARIAKEKRQQQEREAYERERKKKHLLILREQKRKRALKKKMEKKLKRRKKIVATKKKIFGLPALMREKFRYLVYGTKIAAKKALYMFAIILLSSIFLYALWLIAVLRFDLNTSVVKVIAAYIPTPAIITSHDIIDYNGYNVIKGDIMARRQGAGTNEEVKLAIARIIVVKNMARKYNLPFNITESGGKIDDGLKEELARKIVYDDTVNQVGINRIRKIKQLIDKSGDFVRTANTYGDEQGQVDINAGNRDSLDYAEAISDLNAGDVSDIIYTPEGYYIFKCYQKTAADSALSYVFVRAKTLEKYIDETVANMRMWSWVD